MFLIFIIGYLTAATGLFIGSVITLVLSGYARWLKGVVMSFTGGLLVSFICFEILSNALSISGIYVGIAGTLTGVLLTVCLEARAKKKGMGIAVLMCAAIVFHSVPEGIALGSMISNSINAGIMFSVILAIHCLPEGIAAASCLKKGNVSSHRIILSAFILALPMGFGAFTGAFLNSVSTYVFSVSLSLAGGVMLYITCGEILPESKESSGSIVTVLLAAVGFILGSIIIGKF